MSQLNFWRRFVAVGKTWIHSERIKESKNRFADQKGYDYCFWKPLGIILINNLEKWKTISGVYYATFLDRLNQETKSVNIDEQKREVSPRNSAP